jgi:hypothetical protein
MPVKCLLAGSDIFLKACMEAMGAEHFCYRLVAGALPVKPAAFRNKSAF